MRVRWAVVVTALTTAAVLVAPAAALAVGNGYY